MEIRPTTAADLPALDAVFRAAIGEVFRRHAFEPPSPPPEAFAAQHRHLLRHDGERCFVAEEDGRVTAYVAAFERGDAWFLSSLFVCPSHQGRGLGRALLERAWGGESRRRLTLTDSIQPISNGLYARHGLVPTTPLLALVGTPRVEERDALESAAPTADELVALDRAAYGFDRSVDHAYWSGVGRGTLWLRGGEPAAYSYVVDGAWIGPVAGVDGQAAADALRAELGRAEGQVRVLVPGTSRELVETALAAGLRIGGPPGLLLLSAGAQAPTSLAISGYTLF
jgi:GNAT superfamily N-acetyltransferase